MQGTKCDLRRAPRILSDGRRVGRVIQKIQSVFYGDDVSVVLSMRFNLFFGGRRCEVSHAMLLSQMCDTYCGYPVLCVDLCSVAIS